MTGRTLLGRRARSLQDLPSRCHHNVRIRTCSSEAAIGTQRREALEVANRLRIAPPRQTCRRGGRCTPENRKLRSYSNAGGVLTGLGSSLKYILSKEETEWMSCRTSRSSYKSGRRSSSKATRSRWMLEEMPGGEFVKKRSIEVCFMNLRVCRCRPRFRAPR